MIGTTFGLLQRLVIVSCAAVKWWLLTAMLVMEASARGWWSVGAEVENFRGGRVFWHLSGIGGLGRCPGVRVIYRRFSGATVHGDAAYCQNLALIANCSDSYVLLFCGRESLACKVPYYQAGYIREWLQLLI